MRIRSDGVGYNIKQQEARLRKPYISLVLQAAGLGSKILAQLLGVLEVLPMPPGHVRDVPVLHLELLQGLHDLNLLGELALLRQPWPQQAQHVPHTALVELIGDGHPHLGRVGLLGDGLPQDGQRADAVAEERGLAGPVPAGEVGPQQGALEVYHSLRLYRSPVRHLQTDRETPSRDRGNGVEDFWLAGH
eukprot:scaffold80830_cov38-Prasinocladus_malaysianus.AAC.1